LEDIPVFPIELARRISPLNGEAPAPYPWAPKFLPEHWVYTDGSDITGHLRLGSAVVHIPTNTTIYIDAAGIEETRTIMRAEMVAIHTALTTSVTHDWIEIFTDYLSSLQAIRHYHTIPGTTNVKHYHHHRLVMGSNTNVLETIRLTGLRTTLHKVKAHTNIQGNELADAAANLAVTHYETLPPPQTRRVEIEEIAPRLVHRVMYSVKPPLPLLALSTGTNCATFRRPW
jgi:ribonuclease HI